MSALWNHYHRPLDVAEALELLGRYAGQARVLGGGTDLLLEMQQGHRPPVEALVDVTAVSEMNALRQNGPWIEVGAAVPHTTIVESALILRHAACLVESCGVIGGPQVRNVGTLGGNVAHALPAADGTTALMALDAHAEVASAAGRVWLPVAELFTGPGISAVDQTRELIVRFRFGAAAAGSGSAFKRIMRPQGVALPILACAVWLRLAGAPWGRGAGEQGSRGDVVEEARICLGPVGPVPQRATEAEAALLGRSAAEALEDVVAAAQGSLRPRRSKYRATAEYRQEMIATLLRRALPLAAHRAATGEIVAEGVGLD
jgi:carbon-monoxide dehydrogenase medium subunit